MVKIGIIGCGVMGAVHAKVYVENKECKLVCVCDSISEKASELAQQFGAKPYAHIEELIETEDLDLVDVCTTDTEHFEPVMKALDAGIHVFCEKPLAMNSAEAFHMLRKAKERDLFLGVDFNRRFSPFYLQAKQYLDKGELGKPVFLRMNLCQGGEYALSRCREKYYLLFELQIHAIDMMRYFAGDPEEVFAQFIRTHHEVYTTCAITMRFKSGCLGVLLGSWDADFTHPIESFEISGTKGRIIVDNIVDGLTFWRYREQELFGREIADAHVFRPNIFHQRDFWITFSNHINRVIRSISKCKPPPVTGVDGVRSLEIIETAIKSFEERQLLPVEYGVI
jgi:predicted dehydrogenase